MDPNDPMVRKAVLGKRVQDFMTSAIGEYMLGRIEDEKERAQEKLNKVAPWRRTRIQDLQNQIKVVESVRNWLADAVLEGEQATQILEEHG